MRIDRSHVSWALFVFVTTAIAALLYAANVHPHRLPVPIQLPAFFGEVPPARHAFGGTPLGLVFGFVAYVIFLFASALGIRKKRRLWPIGHVQLWLKAHIWLTILTIPLVLFHCGFRAGGAHTTWLMILYTIVMFTGFFGLALQQFMPRLMKDRLPREVVFEEIPYLRSLLHEAAARLRENLGDLKKNTGKRLEPAAAASAASGLDAARETVAHEDPSIGVLSQFLDEECLPYLAARRGDRLPLGDTKTAADLFRMLKVNVAGQWQSMVEDLEHWCSDRRLMDRQEKYHHWLQGWLIIHVPASFALLIFTAWHGWIAVRFLVILH